MLLLSYETYNENCDYKYRKNTEEIPFHPGSDFDTLAEVCFFLIVLKAPAETGNAEKKINKRAERKQYVAYEEVLAVENIFSRNRVKTA